jgi:hypothetical protein
MRRIVESTRVSLDGVIGDLKEWGTKTILALAGSKALPSGVVVLTYRPAAG